jgi:molybdenum cofactor cytidylyltransferase
MAAQLYFPPMNKTGIIILAAGNSSRLGRPKQLLPYRGKTLLTHITTEALNASLYPVMVVTGAFQMEIRDSLLEQAIEIAHNPDWEKGMASGIVAGLSKILSLYPDIEAVIIAVCDQPYISADLFRQLTEKHEGSGKAIIASAYSGTAGTPVLFDSKYFRELLTLSGGEGAKQLLQRYRDDVLTVPFPQGEIDIDKEEDVHKLSGV